MNKHILKALAVSGVLVPITAMAQSGGGGSVDFTSAATEMKTSALAALSAVGPAVLAVMAAIAAFFIAKKLFSR